MMANRTILPEPIIVEVIGLGIKKIDGNDCERGEVLNTEQLLMNRDSILTRIQQGYIRPRTEEYFEKFEASGPNPRVSRLRHDPDPLIDSMKRPLKDIVVLHQLDNFRLMDDDQVWGGEPTQSLEAELDRELEDVVVPTLGETDSIPLPDISEFTVRELREALSSRKLPTAGRKTELVERLKNAIYD